ncbi:MAG: hypothetical protein ACYS30_24965, partial [Planctomycetota bacterium]
IYHVTQRFAAWHTQFMRSLADRSHHAGEGLQISKKLPPLPGLFEFREFRQYVAEQFLRPRLGVRCGQILALKSICVPQQPISAGPCVLPRERPSFFFSHGV